MALTLRITRSGVRGRTRVHIRRSGALPRRQPRLLGAATPGCGGRGTVTLAAGGVEASGSQAISYPSIAPTFSPGRYVVVVRLGHGQELRTPVTLHALTRGHCRSVFAERGPDKAFCAVVAHAGWVRDLREREERCLISLAFRTST